MNGFEGLYAGQEAGKVDRIIALVERIKQIDNTIDRIKYDNELVTEVPEVLKTMGAARDAAIAELKTI